MQLEEADIQEFIELWEQEFHERLASGEVQARASILLEFYAEIAKAWRQEVSSSNDTP